eukprot:TRINITY_DN10895_c0_g1_i1.p1 TRINITY_DN10895_c0_g1~~TRINITY_DN10895_c0_g1_i1.p1  ORF type:complete len:227 (-),score=63.56 TRINITY_DN10895_c0_g1_i1:20-673(-)
MADKRMKGTTVVKPVIYGSIAFWLGKKTEDNHTHKWTAFVRGPKNEDYSSFIKKVVFSLHPSFPNPKRVLEKPPYEITVTGWGEFDINIRIYFDAQEKPLEFFHPLKLYPQEGSNPSTKKPVVSESYDEMIFTDPSEAFYKKLISAPRPLPPNPLAEHYTKFNEAADLKKITDADAKIKAEIKKFKEKFELLDAEAKSVQKEIDEFSNQKKRKMRSS